MPNFMQTNPALDAIMRLGNNTHTPFSYAQGGMVGPGGMPAPMGAPMGAPMPMQQPGLEQPGQMMNQPMDYQSMEREINQFSSQHPQEIAQISQTIQQALASGELTPQELNMMVQMATVVAQDPSMYPQMRNFAIQQGLADEHELSPQYDEGLVFTILLAGQALQNGGQAAGGQPMGGQPMGGQPMGAGPVPSMAQGGKVPASGRDDGSVTINAHEGEYVVPANVVQMKGKEFFDNLVEKYRGR